MACKGAETSWHLDWLAFDVILDEWEIAQDFKTVLITKGYRVLQSGGVMSGVNLNRAFHVQYAWPVINDFERKNCLSHLAVMVKRMPRLFEQYGEIIVKEEEF